MKKHEYIEGPKALQSFKKGNDCVLSSTQGISDAKTTTEAQTG